MSYQVLVFRKIEFEEGGWGRSSYDQGHSTFCVKYDCLEDQSWVRVQLAGGSPEVEVNCPKGTSVLVQDRTVHLPKEAR